MTFCIQRQQIEWTRHHETIFSGSFDCVGSFTYKVWYTGIPRVTSMSSDDNITFWLVSVIPIHANTDISTCIYTTYTKYPVRKEWILNPPFFRLFLLVYKVSFYIRVLPFFLIMVLSDPYPSLRTLKSEMWNIFWSLESLGRWR